MIIIGQIISAFAKSGAKVAPFYYVYFKEIPVLIFFIYYYQKYTLLYNHNLTIHISYSWMDECGSQGSLVRQEPTCK